MLEDVEARPSHWIKRDARDPDRRPPVALLRSPRERSAAGVFGTAGGMAASSRVFVFELPGTQLRHSFASASLSSSSSSQPGPSMGQVSLPQLSPKLASLAQGEPSTPACEERPADAKLGERPLSTVLEYLESAKQRGRRVTVRTRRRAVDIGSSSWPAMIAAARAESRRLSDIDPYSSPDMEAEPARKRLGSSPLRRSVQERLLVLPALGDSVNRTPSPASPASPGTVCLSPSRLSARAPSSPCDERRDQGAKQTDHRAAESGACSPSRRGSTGRVRGGADEGRIDSC